MKAAEGYCVKCKAKQIMKDAVEGVIQGKAGKRNVMRGTCPNCGTKMIKFVKAS